MRRENDNISLSGETVLARDVRLLFTTRILRMAGYGALAVILGLYLAQLGFSEKKIGLLLTLTLIGDTAISLWLTVVADRMGRRKVLIIGAGLMVLAGIGFVISTNWIVLLVTATIGVISPSGKEVGPFLSIEQAALSQVISAQRRTHFFAWYNLVGSMAAAVGALCGGVFVDGLRRMGAGPLTSFKIVLGLYAATGIVLAAMFLLVSKHVEASVPEAQQTPVRMFLGLHESRGIVARLSALFALDAFGGGFVIDSIVALWFNLKFGLSLSQLGTIFFFTNFFAGFSGLVAARLANRFGLINTMVFTHLPSNILLMLVPAMPNAWSAIAVLLARFAISQMDVPTRQSYTMAVVRPEERSAAAGVTGVARTLGAAIAPVLAGPMLASARMMGWPFLIGGGVKIVYDLLLYRSFSKVKKEEHH
ncbi:MAG TPA: MFS transporter [Tepidisphaeraceae bacterium]|nr:MFS transporter [Tepidisphaeraceae bacterium]